MNNINIKKGLLRIWLVVGILWVVILSLRHGSEYQYAYRYIFDRQALTDEDKVNGCKYELIILKEIVPEEQVQTKSTNDSLMENLEKQKIQNQKDIDSDHYFCDQTRLIGNKMVSSGSAEEVSLCLAKRFDQRMTEFKKKQEQAKQNLLAGKKLQDDQYIERCYARFKLSPPNYGIFVLIYLVPTLGILVATLMWKSLAWVALWIWKGFK